MDEDRQYRIRARAYELWEEAAKPDGKHAYFWRMAEKDITHADTGGEAGAEHDGRASSEEPSA